MIAFVGLSVLLSVQTSSEPLLDAPPLEWVMQRAPYGMDVTLDGKVWINTNRTGARDDYAILANDLYAAVKDHSMHPRLWVRGYHLKNRSVTYRETKQLVWIDCARDTIQLERKFYYSGSGELVASEGPFAADPIVPGSIGESWRKAACPADN